MTAPDAAGSISAPDGSQRIEPKGLDAGTRVAIVAAEYHTDIVQPLVDGAVAECIERGVAASDISIVPIPGAFEVGLAAQHCAQNGYDAVIALACVIRGDTPHGVPVAFGVLTVETHQQAVDRIGGSEGHKGREAAGAALGLLSTLRAI